MALIIAPKNPKVISSTVLASRSNESVENNKRQ